MDKYEKAEKRYDVAVKSLIGLLTIVMISLLGFAVVSGFTGCSAPAETVIKSDPESNARFIKVDRSVAENSAIKYTIFVDKETKVQYLYIDGGYKEGGGATILVDSEGKPLLYNGEL